MRTPARVWRCFGGPVHVFRHLGPLISWQAFLVFKRSFQAFLSFLKCETISLTASPGHDVTDLSIGWVAIYSQSWRSYEEEVTAFEPKEKQQSETKLIFSVLSVRVFERVEIFSPDSTLNFPISAKIKRSVTRWYTLLSSRRSVVLWACWWNKLNWF